MDKGVVVAVTLNPYISFRDSARPALEFYHGVFGGELTMTTFAESGMGDSTGIMHGMLVTPALTLMAADTPAEMEYSDGSRIQISLSGDDEATLRSYWDGLTEGASIVVPLEKAPWGDTFGMFADQFGVSWMINIAGAPSA
jgi:PhnB protein